MQEQSVIRSDCTRAKVHWKTQRHLQKLVITQRLQPTYEGQLEWRQPNNCCGNTRLWNPRLPTNLCVIKWTHIWKCVNNPPHRDYRQTANPCFKVIKREHTNINGHKNTIISNIQALCAKVGYEVYTLAQVHRLEEAWLTIRGDGHQDLIASEEVWTSPVIHVKPPPPC